MKVYLGIDLGSTTSKAVIINQNHRIIGRGITNTRSNYEIAADIARMEAEFNSRLMILYQKLEEETKEVDWKEVLELLENRFHYFTIS